MSQPASPSEATLDASLDALRAEIDTIDAALHALLIDRGAIIDRLIAAKARTRGGSAFRPAREAAMMRRLVERHRGILPLDTVEGIWRIIISTFTFVQSPYRVHADVSGGDARMRDACRFHFGFTVPLITHHSAAAALAAMEAGAGDLAVIAASAEGTWWDGFAGAERPKIIARLPFVERADHAAGLPLFVAARSEPASQDVLLHVVHSKRRIGACVQESPVTVVSEAIRADGVSTLIAGPRDLDPDALAEEIGSPDATIAYVGSHAARCEVDGAGLASVARQPATSVAMGAE